MRISPLDMEWAQPGLPMTAEKFFVQKTSVMKTAKGSRIIWGDAYVDGNVQGFDNHDQATGCMRRLIEGHHYGGGVQLRVVRRTCTIETEVVAG